MKRYFKENPSAQASSFSAFDTIGGSDPLVYKDELSLPSIITNVSGFTELIKQQANKIYEAKKLAIKIKSPQGSEIMETAVEKWGYRFDKARGILDDGGGLFNTLVRVYESQSGQSLDNFTAGAYQDAFIKGRGSRQMKSMGLAAKEFLKHGAIYSAASRGPSLNLPERQVDVNSDVAETLRYAALAAGGLLFKGSEGGARNLQLDDTILSGNFPEITNSKVRTAASTKYLAGKTALTTLGKWFQSNITSGNPTFRIPLDFSETPSEDGTGLKIPKFFATKGGYEVGGKVQPWSLEELIKAKESMAGIWGDIVTALGADEFSTENEETDLKKAKESLSTTIRHINGYIAGYELARRKDPFEWLSSPTVPEFGGGEKAWDVVAGGALATPALERGRTWFLDHFGDTFNRTSLFSNDLLDPSLELAKEQHSLAKVNLAKGLADFMESRFNQGGIYKILAAIDSGLVKSAANASLDALRKAQSTSLIGRAVSSAESLIEGAVSGITGKDFALGEAEGGVVAAAKEALANQAELEKAINTEDAELEKEQATELTKERDRYYLALLGKQAEDIRATDPAQEVAKKIKFLDEKRKGYGPYIGRLLESKRISSEKTKKSLDFEKGSVTAGKSARQEILQKKYDQQLAVMAALKERQALYDSDAGLAHLYFANTNSHTRVGEEALGPSIWNSDPSYLQRFTDLKRKYFIDRTPSEVESAAASGGASPSDVIKEFGEVPSPGGRGWITFAEIRNLKGNSKGDRFRQFFEEASPEERIRIMQGIGARPVDPKNLPEGVAPKAENVKNSLLSVSQDIPFQFLLHEMFDAAKGSPETQKLLETIKSTGLPYNDTEPLGTFLKTTKFPITSKLLGGGSVEALPSGDVDSILRYISEFQINDWMEANQKALKSEGGPLQNLNQLLGQTDGAELNKYPVFWDWTINKMKLGEDRLTTYFKSLLSPKENWSDPESWEKKYGEIGLALLGNTDYTAPVPNPKLQDKINKAKGNSPFLIGMDNKAILAKAEFGNPNPPTFAQALKNVMGDTLGFSTNEKFNKFISNTAHPFPSLNISTEGRTDTVKNIALSEIDTSDNPQAPFAPYGYRYHSRKSQMRKSPEGLVDGVRQLFGLIVKDKEVKEANASGFVPNFASTDNKIVPRGTAENAKKLSLDLGDMVIKLKKLEKDSSINLDDPGASVGIRGARGFVPNFSAVAGEIAASRAAGYKTPVTPSQVKTMNIPGVGKTSYNTQESVFKAPGMSQPFIRPPANSKAAPGYAKEVKKKFNFNPYGAASGFVPNMRGGVNFKEFNSSVSEFTQTINILDQVVEQMGRDNEAQATILERAGQAFKESVDRLGDQPASAVDVSGISEAMSPLTAAIGRLQAEISSPLQVNTSSLEQALGSNTAALSQIGGTVEVQMPNVNVDVSGGDLGAAIANQILPVISEAIQAQVLSKLKGEIPSMVMDSIQKGFV